MTLAKKDLDTKWAMMFRSCKHPEAAKKHWSDSQRNQAKEMNGRNRFYMSS